MEFKRTGVVLYTEKYSECVPFCRDVIGLRQLFKNDEVTCFDFGGSYLMVSPATCPVHTTCNSTGIEPYGGHNPTHP